MTADARRILEDALRLSPEERADVAGWLLESLDEPADEDVDAAWRREVARRVQELEEGTVATVSWEDLRRDLARRISDSS